MNSRFSAVDAVLQRAVADGAVPNVTAVAADRDGKVYEGAAGTRTVGGTEAVDGETLYRIMSMTKMLTTVAALRLVERGRLDLEARVVQYCPRFADRHVLDGFQDGRPVLRRPLGEVTVRHLMTHTSGLGYGFWDSRILRWEAVTGAPRPRPGAGPGLETPLMFDPGTQYAYGIGIDWLGLLIEDVTEATLDTVFAEGITGPLGMTRTVYNPDAAQRRACVPIAMRDPEGVWVDTDIDHPATPEWHPGGLGLYSTANDYLRFQQMLLSGGGYDGARILSADTVKTMFVNQIGDVVIPPIIRTADPVLSADFPPGANRKWGYGLLLNTDDVSDARAAGSGSWSGLYNTHFWVDPVSGVTGALYSQTLPFCEPRALDLYRDYEQALYKALRTRE